MSDAFDSNVLTDINAVQVTSEIDQYDNLVANTPIQGSVMVTHVSNKTVDISSFTLGGKPLKVDLVQSMPMSTYSSLEVSIYRFKLEGMKQGVHVLPSIKVKVGGQFYEAPPLTLQIS